MEKIYTFKLNSGAQLIAKTTPEFVREEWIELDSPYLLNISMNKESNTPVISLVPYMFEVSVSERIYIRGEEVRAYSEVSVDLENYYIQSTSGIDLTTKLNSNTSK